MQYVIPIPEQVRDDEMQYVIPDLIGNLLFYTLFYFLLLNFCKAMLLYCYYA